MYDCFSELDLFIRDVMLAQLILLLMFSSLRSLLRVCQSLNQVMQ